MRIKNIENRGHTLCVQGYFAEAKIEYENCKFKLTKKQIILKPASFYGSFSINEINFLYHHVRGWFSQDYNLDEA